MPISYPRIRYVMGHPALKSTNMLITARRSGFDFNLQQQMEGISENLITTASGQTRPEHALLFYSPFDKAGAAFFVGVGAAMLGRCGLPEGYDVTSPASSIVKVTQVFGNADTIHRDLWHVYMMGWIVPELYLKSRPTYSWNLFGDGFFASGGLIFHDAKATTARLIHIKPEHIDPIWGYNR